MLREGKPEVLASPKAFEETNDSRVWENQKISPVQTEESHYGKREKKNCQTRPGSHGEDLGFGATLPTCDTN